VKIFGQFLVFIFILVVKCEDCLRVIRRKGKGSK